MKPAHWIAALTFAAAALAAAPAAAAGGDAVVLKDGAVVKGTITEVKEGSHVLVTIDGGQVARVRWDVIARMERAGGAPLPAAAAPPAAAPAPAAGAASVWVHIDAPDMVQLERVEGRNSTVVCSSPCDIAVPLGVSYKITGSMKQTRTFALAGQPGQRVFVAVDPASRGAFAGGIVLVSLGGVAVLTGGVIYLVAQVADAVDKKSNVTGAKTAGLLTMGLGLGGLVGGVVLVATNGSSSVQQRVGAPPPLDASTRHPEWASVDNTAALFPKAVSLPVISF